VGELAEQEQDQADAQELADHEREAPVEPRRRAEALSRNSNAVVVRPSR
jgi:hypothetical protein